MGSLDKEVVAVNRKMVVAFVLFGFMIGQSLQADGPWTKINTSSGASLRGLSAVDKNIVWACGSGGTVLRSIDSGATWQKCSLPGLSDKTEIRSIHASSASIATVAVAGQPALILQTTDGGKSWATVHSEASSSAFFDGLQFWNDKSGIAFSDPVDGALLIVITDDGGATWRAVDKARIPAIDEGEAGFAASNSSLTVLGNELAWIGLGGGTDGPARMFYSQDRGKAWSVSTVSPIRRNQSSGVFSVRFQNERYGVAVGGDYKQEPSPESNVAISDDGGKSWRNATGTPPSGFRSCVVLVQLKDEVRWLCCGPKGCDLSRSGDDWKRISELGFHTLSVASDGTVWASGSAGRVGRTTVAELLKIGL